MIAVIDYGMGNLNSVEKALEVAGAKTKVTSDPRDMERCEKIVFPGVGAFGQAMDELKRRKLLGPIKDMIAGGKPFLGLCLGLQLLFEESEEARGVKGLSVLRGKVRRFRFRSRSIKVPHMGWNVIEKRPGTGGGPGDLLKGVVSGSYMYFVHSYYVNPQDKDVIFTTTDYGIRFVSGIRADNIYGFQFHPEKSQGTGLKILKNFAGM